MKPGLYWNGINLDFGFWIVHKNGKMFFSDTPVVGGTWKRTDMPLQQRLMLKFLCGLDGSNG